MIHPDLCKLPNSRQAFEVANKAKKMLLVCTCLDSHRVGQQDSR